MRATLVGHACWLFESNGTRILTDPVLLDPFEEGTVTACPARTVSVPDLPALDAVYISHRHLDHFHVPSLRLLPKTLPVYCPDDALLHRALSAAGFDNIHPVQPFSRHQIGALTLMAVPGISETFREYGVVVMDGDAAIFDQVDTPMTAATIERLQSEVGRRLDVHIAMFACQDFTFFEGKRRDLAELHATNLSAALRLGARVVVPGAAGFRFVDALGWLNAHLFPISATRFMADLTRLNSDQRTQWANPGDRLLVEGGRVTLEQQAAPFVHSTQQNTDAIAHRPTAPVPPLHDDNENGYPLPFLQMFAERFVGQVMPAMMARAGGDDPVLAAYRQHRVVYRLEVIFPDGTRRTWRFGFDQSPATLTEADSGEAHVHKQIAASALADVCGGRRGCFWMRTRARRSSAVFAMQPVRGGLMVEDIELRDLLTHVMLLSLVAQRGEEDALLAFYGLTTEQ